MGVGGIQFLTACCPEGFSSLLAVVWRSSLSSLPQGPLHRVAHNMVAGFHLREQVRKREQDEVAVFYPLISEVISHHFCCILFVESKPLNPAYAHREGCTQGHGYQKGRIIGVILEFFPITSICYMIMKNKAIILIGIFEKLCLWVYILSICILTLLRQNVYTI